MFIRTFVLKHIVWCEFRSGYIVERAAFELAETKDRTTRVESDVAGLRAAMADGNTKVEEVRREAAGLKAELSDCCPKVNKDLTSLERELAKLKEEIRAMRLKPERIAPPEGDIAAPPPLKAASPAMTFSSSSRPPSVAAPLPGQTKQFPPSLKEGAGGHNVPDGVIAHLTRECGGNVHDCRVVDVTSGSFEKETQGANPHSGAYNNDPRCAAKNVADFETDSCFLSAFRRKKEDIPHTRNN
jgi:hypothetical protein